jgi:hypothetical protein
VGSRRKEDSKQDEKESQKEGEKEEMNVSSELIKKLIEEDSKHHGLLGDMEAIGVKLELRNSAYEILRELSGDTWGHGTETTLKRHREGKETFIRTLMILEKRLEDNVQNQF